ncbi:MAG TPA: 50S ribosomal protein L25 [Patescibacteria group bacterium]|jgi:large subunit ribosomal protein L25
MADYTLKAEPREETGKQVGRLRRDGKVPAVLYGHGVKPRNLTLVRGELERVYHKAGGSTVVGIKLDKGEENALIQEVQHDPRTGRYLHADLYRVRMDEKIKATVPLAFEGTALAVRELDGTLLTNLNEVEVECLPGDLPSEIVVDVGTLKTFEDSITVGDLKVASGVEIHAEEDASVATVTPPRTQEELEALDEEDTEGKVEDTEVEGADEEGAEGEGEGEDAGGDDQSDDQKSDEKSDDKKKE